MQKLPYQVILGDKELAVQAITVRNRRGEDLGQMPIASFVEQLKSELVAVFA